MLQEKKFVFIREKTGIFHTSQKTEFKPPSCQDLPKPPFHFAVSPVNIFFATFFPFICLYY